MESYEAKLKRYINEHNVDAVHLKFDQSCHSVEEAAQAVGADSTDFIKSICLLSGDKTRDPIIAIVSGTERVSSKRVAKALEIERPTIATPDEVLSFTGFPCGGTPPFGYSATFLIDPHVMEKETVYAGGGSEQSLIKIKTTELQKANQGTISRIRK
jgi:prolyl-tRNA editing enzyme YbaK/EbsC (Cys-tRNA(Pro) deacylase)